MLDLRTQTTLTFTMDATINGSAVHNLPECGDLCIKPGQRCSQFACAELRTEPSSLRRTHTCNLDKQSFGARRLLATPVSCRIARMTLE